MITIWFEPHSTSLDNEAKLASGWNDVDLSKLGLQQSVELADRSEARNLQAIFTSDLQRAYKSAIPTAERYNLPIYVDRRLRECDYGEMTQQDKAKVDAEKPSRIDKPFPGGESYQQCMKRMGEYLDWLRQNFDGKTVMIIGHRATQYSLEHHVLGKNIKSCVTEPWSWQPGWKYEL